MAIFLPSNRDWFCDDYYSALVSGLLKWRLLCDLVFLCIGVHVTFCSSVQGFLMKGSDSQSLPVHSNESDRNDRSHSTGRT